MNTHSLSVPITFGNIENDSNNNPFQPWLAKEYVGKDSNNNPIYKEIGSFETFSESLLALIMVNNLSDDEYESDSAIEKVVRKARKKINTNLINYTESFDEMEEPGEMSYSNLNNSFISSPNQYNPALDYSNPLMKLTFREVYERWYQDKSLEDITPHTMEGYKNSYKKVSHLADKLFVEIKFSDIDECIKAEKLKGNSFSMRKRVKLFFSQLYQWAISHEMCTTNMALNIKLGKNESESKRRPFTPTQISTLFSHVDEEPFIETVLMLIFTGCRIREFLNIRREDIHMTDRYFIVTQSKTKAGRNRMVPIHKKMIKYFRKRLRAKSDYLIHDARGRQVDYSEYSTKFRNLMKRFGWEGMSPHCCRHTLATMLHSSGADEQTIKRILGHVQGATVTERTYIHIQLVDLHKAIDSI